MWIQYSEDILEKGEVYRMREKNVTKISIIIPVYNVENYLARCLDSIFKHTIPKFEYEVLLVDDGSTDGSGNICDKYEKDYEIVQAIHKENGGLSDARNCGLDTATGDYIWFIDSDDFLIGPLFQRFYEVTQKEEVDIYHFNYLKCEGIVDPMRIEEVYSVYDNRSAFLDYISGKNITRMAWDKIYKRELFNGVRYPVGKLAEDYGTTYKVLGKANRIVYDKNMLYGYFQRANSIMGQRSIRLINDEFEFGICNYEYALDKYPDFQKEIQSTYINLLIKTFARINRYSNASENQDEIYQKINRELKRLILAKAKSRTKIMQVIYFISKKLCCYIMEKKDRRDW